MPKAYSYARFSSEKQSGNDSLRRQIDKAEAYVIKTQAQYGLELDTSRRLTDPAMSAYRGTNLKRGALAAFITAAENGLIEDGSFLLIESFDRLSRQESATSIRLLLDLIESGITVVTLIDERVFSKETIKGIDGTFTLMQSLVTMARAHEESATKGMRVREVWANKMKKITDGVQLTKRVPFWMKPDRTLINDKVDLVRSIYDLHIKGWGDTRIAKKLNSEKIPTPSKKGIWQQSTIRKIINGKQTLGILKTADGNEHENYFPQIITEEEWLKANVMKGSVKTTKTNNEAKPLASLVKCYCGSTMRHQSRTGRIRKDGRRNKWEYLVCSKAAVGAGCHFIGIPYDQLLNRLADELKWISESATTKDDHMVAFKKTELLLDMAIEDTSRAYEAFKNSKTTIARNRLADSEAEVVRLKNELEKLKQAGSDIGNNLVMTLIESPRLNDNTWWRQLVKNIIVNTVTLDIRIYFHNGNLYDFYLDPKKVPADIINAASLWDLVNEPPDKDAELDEY